MIQLLVGLGNPGPEYAETRHNAGFWWLDAVARKLGVTLNPDKSCQGLLARTTFEGRALWLLAPQTFMNNSGRSVAALARFYKIAPEAILVAHDELDLPPGEAKFKVGGGHAGHNGLRDLHAQLGSDRYARLRLGVGHPGQKDEVIHWVLRRPPLDARIAIDQAIDRSLPALPHLLRGEVEAATRIIHTSKPQRPKPPRPVNANANANASPANASASARADNVSTASSAAGYTAPTA